MLPRNSGSAFSTALYQNRQLQQERYVADQFDIAAGEMRDQPIARQPRDADGEAENGREHDAEARDQKRVEKPDPESIAESRSARRIRDQRLADVEAGDIVPEAEARRDMGGGKVARGIDAGGIEQTDDDNDQRDLQRDTAKHADATGRDRMRESGILRSQPWRSAMDINHGLAGPMGPQAVTRMTTRNRRRPANATPQRIGMPYCKPPLVHSAFKPRATFSGEPWPTLRSKLSP